MTDWQKLLDKAREPNAPKNLLNEYMPQICTPEALNDDVKLRLLGNALGSSAENREYLLKQPQVVADLVKPDPIRLTVLHNFCVDFSKGADVVLSHPTELADAIAAEPAAGIRLLHVLTEQHGSLPAALTHKLIDDGFIGIILADTSLETDKFVLDHFAKILDAAIDAPDKEMAVRVIGNISSHPSFTLKDVEGVEPSPTPEFAVLAANLTMKKADMGPALEKWPGAVDNVMELLRDVYENGDYDEDEESEEHEEPPQIEEVTSTSHAPAADSSALQTLEESHDKELDMEFEDEDDSEDFDEFPDWLLESAYFIRNVCRDRAIAEKVAMSGGLELTGALLTSQNHVELGLTIASMLTPITWDEGLVKKLVNLRFSPEYGAALVSALAYTTVGYDYLKVDNKPIAEKLSSKITTLLESIPGVPQTINLWRIAVSALEILARTTTVDTACLKEAPRDPDLEKAISRLTNPVTALPDQPNEQAQS